MDSYEVDLYLGIDLASNKPCIDFIITPDPDLPSNYYKVCTLPTQFPLLLLILQTKL